MSQRVRGGGMKSLKEREKMPKVPVWSFRLFGVPDGFGRVTEDLRDPEWFWGGPRGYFGWILACQH